MDTMEGEEIGVLVAIEPLLNIGGKGHIVIVQETVIDCGYNRQRGRLWYKDLKAYHK